MISKKPSGNLLTLEDVKGGKTANYQHRMNTEGDHYLQPKRGLKEPLNMTLTSFKSVINDP